METAIFSAVSMRGAWQITSAADHTGGRYQPKQARPFLPFSVYEILCRAQKTAPPPTPSLKKGGGFTAFSTLYP
jgi:hypothetical protein